MSGATLLLAHGGGFCKESWEPIVRRLRTSPLLARLTPPVRCVTFDFPFHGSKRDESEAAALLLEAPTSPRVRHRGNNWLEWSSAEAHAQVQALRRNETQRTPLIGIGHSMGAAALWTTEVRYPGTFDGLVLFEPVTGVPEADSSKSIDFLVALTLQRESRWSSREAAMAHFDSLRNFAAWDREALQSYVRGAVVPDAVGDTSAEVVLACSPLVEASFYCGKMLAFNESELARPRCRTVFQSGERSQLFRREYFEELAARLPHVYSLGSPIPKGSHLMVLEDPGESAARILDALAQFPPFCGHGGASDEGGRGDGGRPTADAKSRL